MGAAVSARNPNRICSRCGGRKESRALVCRPCKRPDEWPKPNLGKRGADHTAWKGGRLIDEDGYVRLYLPDYRFRRPRSPYVYEHVKIIEDEIGRQLAPAERVHHRDLDRTNNDRANLQLLTLSAHCHLHGVLNAPLRTRDALGRFATEVTANV